MVNWISTHKQRADVLTKALGTQQFIALRDKIMCNGNHTKGGRNLFCSACKLEGGC